MNYNNGLFQYEMKQVFNNKNKYPNSTVNLYDIKSLLNGLKTMILIIIQNQIVYYELKMEICK